MVSCHSSISTNLKVVMQATSQFVNSQPLSPTAHMYTCVVASPQATGNETVSAPIHEMSELCISRMACTICTRQRGPAGGQKCHYNDIVCGSTDSVIALSLPGLTIIYISIIVTMSGQSQRDLTTHYHISVQGTSDTTFWLVLLSLEELEL